MNVSIVEPQDMDNTLLIAEYLECKKFAGIQEYRKGEIKIIDCQGKSHIHSAISLQKKVKTIERSLHRDFYPCLLFWN